MSYFRILFCFFSVLPLCYADKPVVLWSSNPVSCGQTVMLFGGNWDSTAKIKLLELDGKSVEGQPLIEPSVATETNITFVFPVENLPKTLRAAVVCKDLESEPFTINKPVIWWIHGDWGKEASPNGWIRLYGTAVATWKSAPEAETTLKLLSETDMNKIYSLKIYEGDRWHIEGKIPANIPEGNYEVVLSDKFTGTTTAGTITVKKHTEIWKTDEFNVVDFGAVPNDKQNDTAAVHKALEKIAANGGGILHFPRGRFQLEGGFELPPNTLLQGAGRELTQLYWLETDMPPEALIRGTHSFGIKDITIFSANHLDGIVSNTLADEENGNITIENVCVRLLFTHYLYMNGEEMSRRAIPLHHKRLLRLGGNFIRVIDCDLHAAGGGVFEIAGNWVQVSNNILSKGQVQGWNGFGGSQIIFEDNEFRGPMCTSFYNRREGSQNIYWGYNKHLQTYDGNNRETVTGDIRDLTYADTAESWEENAVVLKNVKWRENKKYKDWIGGYIQLMDGKGTGQLRKITKIDGNRVEFECPWDIKPDKNTFLIIAGFRKRFLYAGNDVSDSTIGMQFYGSMIEPVVANSVFRRTGGSHGFGMVYEPNWFFQFIGNIIEEGNASRGPFNDIPASDAHFGFCDRGVPGERQYPQCRVCVMRNNMLKNNAKLFSQGLTDGILIEENNISNADIGIELLAPGRNLQVRNNEFENVLLPYYITAAGVHIDPLEYAAANIGSAKLLLETAKKTILLQWETLLSELVELKKNTELSTAERKQKADEFLLKAVQVYSGMLSKDNADADSVLLERLMGFRLTIPNWKPVTELVQRSPAGKAGLLLRVDDTMLFPCKAKITVDADYLAKFNGWTFGDAVNINYETGKYGDGNLTVSKPAGAVELLSLPLVAELIGDKWSFKCKTFIDDPWAVFTMKQLLAAGPIANVQDKKPESLFLLPKYKVDAKECKSAPLQQGGLNLRELFAVEKGNNLYYVVSALKAAKPLTVRIAPADKAMLCVNGKAIGIKSDRIRSVPMQLNEGVNTLVMIVLDDNKTKDWKISPPRIYLQEPLFPNDLTEVPVPQLFGTEFPAVP